MSVKPKKFLGQHFLKNRHIAEKIVNSLIYEKQDRVVEVGPGTGVLTQLLVGQDVELDVVEFDPEAAKYLMDQKLIENGRIWNEDILRINFQKILGNDTSFHVIGNFPYNISSQIFFRILKERMNIKSVVCMIQKEVAQRIVEGPGSKVYGILSVLLQAYFDIEFLFKVGPKEFHPPPKVESAVIRLTRNDTVNLDCDEKLFFRVVKQGFQNRRKTLRNALKPLNLPDSVKKQEILDRRAETLSVEDYVDLTNLIQQTSVGDSSI